MRLHFYILMCAAFAGAHAAEPPTLVTGGLTNIAGASDSFIEAITPDGRWAVMVSHANNLTTNDDLQPYSDIFVRDLQAGRTLLVSVSTNGSAGGNGNSHDGWISPDGRYVIFASDASNLIPNDTNGVTDVFRRDLQTGTTELVSVARSGGVASTSINRLTIGASHAVVTPDGRWVAFESASTEFVEGDTNPTGKIFVRDMQTGITRLATEAAQYSRLGSITDDGRFVAFIAQSAASMPGRTNVNGDVFVADLQTGQQFWASTNLPSPIVLAYRCYAPVVALDGRTVWFNATVSGTTYLLEHDFTTAETTIPETVPPDVWRKMNPGLGPLIAADGITEFFDTAAALVANDNNGSHDVFRRDGITTELVSVADPSRLSKTAMRSITFDRDMVDATATRIAFISPDIPGVPGDNNGFLDIFVRDVATGELYAFPTQYDWFSTNFSRSMKALDPRLSADGVVLAFVRQNLTDGVPASADLVWHVIGGDPPLVLTNISTDLPWTMSSNGQVLVYYQSGSYWWNNLGTGFRLRLSPSIRGPVISPDNQLLALQSFLGPEVYHPVSNVVLRITNTFPAKVNSQLVFSSGNRFLFYEGTSNLFRHDLQTRRTDVVCTNCMNLDISATGEIVTYNATAGGGGTGDIIVNDLRTGIERVITTEFGTTNAFSRRFSVPSVSADGRYIVFSTTLTNALAGDFNSRSDVYVYDRVGRSTLLVSRSRFGEGPAAGSSTVGVMARDGRSVVFQSFANDLVDGDYNQERDIFIVRLGVGDSDNDGMDDDWEVAHFGDLSHNGAGDQDGDGQTDLQEFLAGTNPTNGSSILRVLTITPMGGGSTTVSWSAVVGRDYVVQSKDSLDGGWTNASSVLRAHSPTMAFTHGSSSPRRFYRVVAVQ